MASNYPHYRSQFADTTFTKVFVGGLAWETPTEEMRSYFEQFGEILEAVIIKDKNTGKSKGYGFVTYRDPESARRACADPNPVIDGRRANCNIASLGRPRPSPPRGRPQGGNAPHQQGSAGSSMQGGGGGPSSYSGVGTAPLQPLPLPPPPPPPPVMYPPYGYQPYTPDYGYHQVVYNTQLQQQQAQYYQQMYGTTSTGTMGSPAAPYGYYGYSLQPPRVPPPISGAGQGPQRVRPPPPAPGGPTTYFYYPTSSPPPLDQAVGPTSPVFPAGPPPPLLQFQPTIRHPFQPPPPPPTSESQNPQQTTTTESEAAAVHATSQSPSN